MLSTIGSIAGSLFGGGGGGGLPGFSDSGPVTSGSGDLNQGGFTMSPVNINQQPNYVLIAAVVVAGALVIKKL